MIKNVIIYNAKGDLSSDTSWNYMRTFNNFDNNSYNFTFNSNGSVNASGGNGDTHSWVETGSGWQGGSFYTMTNIAKTGGTASSGIPASGAMSSGKTFSISDSNGFADFSFTLTNTTTGASRNCTLHLTINNIQ